MESPMTQCGRSWTLLPDEGQTTREGHTTGRQVKEQTINGQGKVQCQRRASQCFIFDLLMEDMTCAVTCLIGKPPLIFFTMFLSP